MQAGYGCGRISQAINGLALAEKRPSEGKRPLGLYRDKGLAVGSSPLKKFYVSQIHATTSARIRRARLRVAEGELASPPSTTRIRKKTMVSAVNALSQASEDRFQADVKAAHRRGELAKINSSNQLKNERRRSSCR
jgi:hypothetical protein